jgi:cytochrome bd-type quinol oxidase subunit 1
MSLTVYVLAYIVIFGAGGYFMWRFLRAGPTDKRAAPQRRRGTPARPLSAAGVD